MIERKRHKDSDYIFDILVNSLVIMATIIVLYPLYFLVIASISDPYAVNSGRVLLFPVTPNLDGYRAILRDNRIWTGYFNTIVYTAFGSLLALILTILGGYALSRKDLIGSTLVMKLMVFTMFFNGGLIPTYMVVKNLHLIDTPFTLIILGSFSAYNLVIARTFFLTKVPKEFYEAATIDGCGEGKYFTSIVLPLSKEIVAVIALFYAVGHWNSFFNALVYVNSQKLYPLQLILRDILIASQTYQPNINDPEMLIQMQKVAESIKYCVIIVSALPVLLLYPFIQRYFEKGIMIGGIKG